MSCSSDGTSYQRSPCAELCQRTHGLRSGDVCGSSDQILTSSPALGCTSADTHLDEAGIRAQSFPRHKATCTPCPYTPVGQAELTRSSSSTQTKMLAPTTAHPRGKASPSPCTNTCRSPWASQEPRRLLKAAGKQCHGVATKQPKQHRDGWQSKSLDT